MFCLFYKENVHVFKIVNYPMSKLFCFSNEMGTLPVIIDTSADAQGWSHTYTQTGEVALANDNLPVRVAA